METMHKGSAADLIARSISHTEIVHAEWTPARASTLNVDCDGSVVNGHVVEFWGVRDTGDDEGTWRVHLHRAEAE